jgi:hypothetical protein
MKAVFDQLTGQGLSQDQVLHFIADAGNTLCPDVKNALNRVENTA